jgi:hypothetical protein
MPRFGLSQSCSPIHLYVGKECSSRSLAQAAKASSIHTMQYTPSESTAKWQSAAKTRRWPWWLVGLKRAIHCDGKDIKTGRTYVAIFLFIAPPFGSG